MAQDTPNKPDPTPPPAVPPRVLLIDSDREDAAKIGQAIDAALGQGVVTHFTTLQQALQQNLDQYDLTLSAMQVEDASGLKVIDELLLLRPDMPIVMLACEHTQADAAQAMLQGAYDYVIKASGYHQTLPAVVEKNLTIHHVKQENARLQVQLTATLGQLRTRNDQLQSLVRELRAIASTDALTGIANRRAIGQMLDQHYAHALRHANDLSLIAIDLDGFKLLNDSAGHPAGDRVLMLVSRVLSANARGSDVPGRIGGDEFVVLLPETNNDEAINVAKRIQSDFDFAFKDLATRISYSGTVTMSMGIATRLMSDTTSATELLGAADRSLYRAKDAGRACIVSDCAQV